MPLSWYFLCSQSNYAVSSAPSHRCECYPFNKSLRRGITFQHSNTKHTFTRIHTHACTHTHKTQAMLLHANMTHGQDSHRFRNLTALLRNLTTLQARQNINLVVSRGSGSSDNSNTTSVIHLNINDDAVDAVIVHVRNLYSETSKW